MSDDASHAMGNGKCTAVTAKAILFETNGKKIWVPQSVVHADSEVWKKDDEGELIVKYWWAEKNDYV